MNDPKPAHLATPDQIRALGRPVGRPKTITDMKAYKASKAREYRAKAKRLEALK